MNIHYKRAGLEDIDQIIALRVEFLTQYFGKAGPEAVHELEKNMRVYLEKNIPENSYICWIAFDGKEAVAAGGAVLYSKPGNFMNPEGRNAYIMSMFTKKTYRKKGIAGRILKLLEKSCHEYGYSSLELHATSEGEPIYIKHGYQQHKEPTYRKTRK